jgi:hypothetical protein
VSKTVSAGIKFFQSRHGQIIFTGLPDKIKFKNVYVVALGQGILYHAQDSRTLLQIIG